MSRKKDNGNNNHQGRDSMYKAGGGSAISSQLIFFR